MARYLVQPGPPLLRNKYDPEQNFKHENERVGYREHKRLRTKRERKKN